MTVARFKYGFLLSELTKRDFKKKYKRSVLGMGWSLMSPLLSLFVMRLVFTRFFGRGVEHYTTYLFCGNLVFSYFSESATQGMSSLMSNAAIFTKIKVPKFLFLVSKNLQTLTNFALTLSVFFIFCIIEGIAPSVYFLTLIFPIVCLALFNFGLGLILSALFVFFRDIQYLWGVFSQLLMYLSAIFYTTDGYPLWVQRAFYLNPVYLFIRYFRVAVIEGRVPSIFLHALILLDTALILLVGATTYKRCDEKFIYYV